ncbi:MAG: hypothetical protein J1E38_04070 [Paramuribaculum sp.]|nr:hypothetical protein [Paramuribaculum sp.]
MKKLKHVLNLENFTKVYNNGEKLALPEINEQQDYTEDELPEEEQELEEESLQPDPVIQHLEEAAFLAEYKKVLDFDTYVETQYKKPKL